MEVPLNQPSLPFTKSTRINGILPHSRLVPHAVSRVQLVATSTSCTLHFVSDKTYQTH